MEHAFYIIMAYGLTGLVIAALISWVYFDAKGRRGDLDTLDAAKSERQPMPRRDKTP